MVGGYMRISQKKLRKEAQRTGFRPEILEKVVHLLNLLTAMESHPFLKDKIALKGGTALNLFIFDVPRLSVDIDLNYIGAEDKDGLAEIRPKIEQALTAVFSREGFNVRRVPDEHAGGKWPLQYQSFAGQTSNLEVDLNFMFRVPLWPLVKTDSKIIGTWQAKDIPVMDIHEIAAGKLAALLSRKQARDLFDCHGILKKIDLDRAKLRTAFIVYGAMNRKDWRTVSKDDINFEPDELGRQLIPTLSRNAAIEQKGSAKYGQKLVTECQEAISEILTFTGSEQEFLDTLLDNGKIASELITDDLQLQQRIQEHPMLKWKALNVRKHKGVS